MSRLQEFRDSLIAKEKENIRIAADRERKKLEAAEKTKKAHYDRWDKLVDFLEESGCNVLLPESRTSIQLNFSNDSWGYIHEYKVEHRVPCDEISGTYFTHHYKVSFQGSTVICETYPDISVLKAVAKLMNDENLEFKEYDE